MNTENQESMAPQSEEQNHENLEQQILPTESEQVKPAVKNLEITGDINAHLTEAGKWGQFLSDPGLCIYWSDGDGRICGEYRFCIFTVGGFRRQVRIFRFLLFCLD